MLAELGMVLSDPGYRLADRAGHSYSSTFGRGCGSSIATTQANRARELSNEEVAFGVGLRGPLSVPDGARLVDVVFDLGEASAVRVLGSRVELSWYGVRFLATTAPRTSLGTSFVHR